MDNIFFKSWVLHIPHCLRDLLWTVRYWSSVTHIFSSLMSRDSSSSQSLMKVITSFWHTFLILMNESHYPRRPFKEVITTFAFSTSSSTTSRCSTFWIFTFFNYFLKSIFLSSNRLIKESNIFHVFREDTCGTSWSVIESTVIFLALIKFFLCKALRLISL